MTNVLYLHNSASISGGERSLLQLWATLDRSQFAAHLLIPSDGPLAGEARRMGVEVSFLSVPPFKLSKLVAWARAEVGLMRLVKDKKIGLIHSYTPRNNLLAAWVGRLCGVPVIWHERNMLWGAERDITRMFLGVPDAVICNSMAVAGRFLLGKQLPSHVRVILNGVDPEHFSPAKDRIAAQRAMGWEGRRVIGLVSNLNARKGVDVFLDVAALVVRSRKDVVFVVVGGAYGGGDEQSLALIEKARALGLAEHMVWAGAQTDVRPFLSAFDVFCHVTEKEACSRAVLEAMAMGLPVVALRDGGNPELIEDGRSGVLVPAGDAVVLASRLMSLLDDVSLRQRMGEAARRRVEEHFDIMKNTSATQALYRELLKGCP